MRKEKKKWLAKVLVCMLLACSILTINGKAGTLAEEAKQTVAFGEYDTVDLNNGEITVLKVVMKQKGSFTLDFRPDDIFGLKAQLYDAHNNLLGEDETYNGILTLSDFKINSIDAGTYYLRLWTTNNHEFGTHTYFARQTPDRNANLELCISLKKGQSVQLGTIFSNCKNKSVKWSTSNKNIATVSQTGKVVAKKKGTVTIKAFNSSGMLAKMKVRVTDK